MPITFQATIHSYRTDQDGEAKLVLTIPECDRSAGNQASLLTKRALLVTICSQQEVAQEDIT